MRDSNLRGIEFLFLLKFISVLELSIIHPRVSLRRDSFFPLISDVLLCKSLFYRKIFINLDKNILVGYQESPPKVCSDIYVRVLMMTVVSQRYMQSVVKVLRVD